MCTKKVRLGKDQMRQREHSAVTAVLTRNFSISMRVHQIQWLNDGLLPSCMMCRDLQDICVKR